MTDHQTLPMRKAARRITDPVWLAAILDQAEVCTVALHDEPFPYIVPMNFGYTLIDGCITLYLHMAKQGHRQNLLAADPRIAVNVYAYLSRVGHAPYRHEMQDYRSVNLFGTAEPVTDPDELLLALNRIQAQAGRRQYDAVPPYGAAVSVWRLRPEAMTGKSNYPLQGPEELAIPPLEPL